MANNEPAPLSYAPADTQPSLLPTMGFWTLTIYGVGDMLGAGIYALIGRAAGIMGNAVWLGFLVSMVAAMLTGLSYACLGSRYPRAAGAAYITQHAFHRPFLSYVVGLTVMASGLTSMATAARAFAGYSYSLIHATPAATPPAPLLWAGIILFIAGLTFINYWGIRESAWFNVLCTAIEFGGLAFIILIGLRYWGGVNYFETPRTGPDMPNLSAHLVFQGAVLTFFAFVGFEDLLNVAEEVKNPQRTLPWALVTALGIVTLVYIAVSITAISVVPHAELAASSGPLVEVVRRAAPWLPPKAFTLVSLFAITNSALVNYIMGSRLVYGMAGQGLVPRVLGRVHPTRRTPHVAIFTLMIIVLVLALAGDISALGKATAILLLGVFIVINAALVVLKLRPDEPRGQFEIPLVIPAAAIIACTALLAHAKADELKIAIAIGAGIAILYLAVRPQSIPEAG
ncbi:MAG: amino acid permease [Phycisphaerae bacterium]